MLPKKSLVVNSPQGGIVTGRSVVLGRPGRARDALGAQDERSQPGEALHGHGRLLARARNPFDVEDGAPPDFRCPACNQDEPGSEYPVAAALDVQGSIWIEATADGFPPGIRTPVPETSCEERG